MESRLVDCYIVTKDAFTEKLFSERTTNQGNGCGLPVRKDDDCTSEVQ